MCFQKVRFWQQIHGFWPQCNKSCYIPFLHPPCWLISSVVGTWYWRIFFTLETPWLQHFKNLKYLVKLSVRFVLPYKSLYIRTCYHISVLSRSVGGGRGEKLTRLLWGITRIFLIKETGSKGETRLNRYNFMDTNTPWKFSPVLIPLDVWIILVIPILIQAWELILNQYYTGR